MTPLKAISIGVCGLLVVGYANRRRRRVHIPLMVAAFVIDMAMVAYIELTRDAIATAKEKMSTMMIVHISVSVTVILLYLGQIFSGFRKACGSEGRWHGAAGRWLIITRLGNLVTSFIVTQA
jgi:hypothetical protein